MALDGAEKSALLLLGDDSRVLLFGIYAKRAFFIDIGVSHGDYNRVDRDVHHDDVENLNAYAEGRDGDNIEATRSYGERLEESVHDLVIPRDVIQGFVSEVEKLKCNPVDTI